MKKQCYMKYIFLKAITLYVLATLLASFPYTALAMALPPFGANANGAPTYPENDGNAIMLNVQAAQTNGSKGNVVVTALSQGVPASEAFYRNSVKRCVVMSGGFPPFGEELPGMPPMPPIDMVAPLLEVNLSYDSNQQALTGTFSVNSPGLYTIRVELNDGQTTAVGSANAQFLLQSKDVEPVKLSNGQETTVSLANLLGWEGLNLTVQNVEILQSSGAAEISRTASGNAINSLSIKGTRAGDVQVQANIIYNGQSDVAYIMVQVEKNSPLDQLVDWILSIFPPTPISNAPLGVLLAALLILFAILIYLNFFKRIQGSFVASCECGATKLPMELKAPRGRSFTLYQLLDKMLKRQVGNQEADIIRGIVDDSDNKKNLGQIRVYISKGNDKRPHYVFSKAGSPETVIDDTVKKAYPDSGNRNSKLTVNLSFIAQWNSVNRR